MPSLQVSVPGQAVMSTMVPAPGAASCAASRSAWRAGRSAVLTQRSTRFCSTVVRTVSRMYLRAMSATARICGEVMSPSGSAMVTVA